MISKITNSHYMRVLKKNYRNLKSFFVYSKPHFYKWQFLLRLSTAPLFIFAAIIEYISDKLFSAIDWLHLNMPEIPETKRK